jgi:cytochrome c556
MQRKWVILPAMMFAVVALATGFSSAADDEGPLHNLMEQVNKASLAIKKSVRTEVAYKKAQAANDLVKHSEELIKLQKEARGMGKDAGKKAKDLKEPEKKWTELMDACIAETEKFSQLVAKPATKSAEAKSAFGVVSQSCTNCHNVFRVEDESF